MKLGDPLPILDGSSLDPDEAAAVATELSRLCSAVIAGNLAFTTDLAGVSDWRDEAQLLRFANLLEEWIELNQAILEAYLSRLGAPAGEKLMKH